VDDDTGAADDDEELEGLELAGAGTGDGGGGGEHAEGNEKPQKSVRLAAEIDDGGGCLGSGRQAGGTGRLAPDGPGDRRPLASAARGGCGAVSPNPLAPPTALNTNADEDESPKAGGKSTKKGAAQRAATVARSAMGPLLGKKESKPATFGKRMYVALFGWLDTQVKVCGGKRGVSACTACLCSSSAAGAQGPAGGRARH
jgi:hypothetical protein